MPHGKASRARVIGTSDGRRRRRCTGVAPLGAPRLAFLVLSVLLGASPLPASAARTASLLEMEMSFADELQQRGWRGFAAEQLERLQQGRSLVSKKLPADTISQIKLKLARLSFTRGTDKALPTEDRIAALRQSVGEFQALLKNLPANLSLTETTFESCLARRVLAVALGTWAAEAKTPQPHAERLALAEKTFQDLIDEYAAIAKKMTAALVYLDSVPMKPDDRALAQQRLETVGASAEFEHARTRYELAQIYSENDPAEDLKRRRALEKAVNDSELFADTWPDWKLHGLLYQARALCDLKRYADAVSALGDMIKQGPDPNRPDLEPVQRRGFYWAGTALFELERYDELITLDDRARKWFSNAQQDEFLLRLRLLAARATAAKALQMRQQNETGRTWQKLLDRAIRIAQTLIDPPTAVSTRASYYRAEWLAHSSAPLDFEDLRSAAHRALVASSQPDVTAEGKKTKLQQALTLYRKAISMAHAPGAAVNPESLSTAWYNIARCYFFLHRYLEASIAFERSALVLAPTDDEQHQGLVLNRLQLRIAMIQHERRQHNSEYTAKLEEASTEQASDYARQFDASISDLDYRNGLFAQRRGDYLQAIQLYSKVAPTSNYYDRALHNIGQSFFRHAYALLDQAKRRQREPVAFTVAKGGPAPPARQFVRAPRRRRRPDGSMAYDGIARSCVDFAWWAMLHSDTVTVTKPDTLIATMKGFEDSIHNALEALQAFAQYVKASPGGGTDTSAVKKITRRRHGLLASATYLQGFIYTNPPFNDPAKALSLLADFAQKFPEASNYRARAAFARLRANAHLGRTADAERDVAELEQQEGTNEELATAYRLVANLLLRHAEARRQAGHPEQADAATGRSAALLTKLVALDKDQPFQTYANLFYHFFRSKDYAAAAALGNTTLQRFGGREELKDQLNTIRERLAVATCYSGDCEKGIAILLERSKVYEALAEPTREQRSAKWLVNKSLGDCYSHCKQLKEAIAYYNKARSGVPASSPLFWQVHLALCNAGFELKDYDGALAVASGLVYQLPGAPQESASKYLAFLSKLAGQLSADKKKEAEALLEQASALAKPDTD